MAAEAMKPGPSLYRCIIVLRTNSRCINQIEVDGQYFGGQLFSYPNHVLVVRLQDSNINSYLRTVLHTDDTLLLLINISI